ncbi:MAG: class C beta-lactamase [Planctomycetota bacterium]
MDRPSCVRAFALVLVAVVAAGCHSPSAGYPDRIEAVVDSVVAAIMAEHEVPGVAVGVTLDAQPQLFTYGVASVASRQPVGEHTLFEIGSISKVFTATLTGEAVATGALSLEQSASRYVPELAGSAFDTVSVHDLGTYTAGGLPLQFPEGVVDPITYFAHWRPEYAVGTTRCYSNPSIGLLGEVAARSLGAPFEVVMGRLLSRLRLQETYLQVPAERMPLYADGHDQAGKVTRLTPGPMGAPSYGLRTTVGDLLRFVQDNIDASSRDEMLQRAFAATHVGYYTVGGLQQGLGWEMYEDPADLDTLLAGNSADVIFEAKAVERLPTPRPAHAGMLFDKTGSTNGFSAYVVFVPQRRIGVVLLANKSIPIPDRVRAAHRILMALAE